MATENLSVTLARRHQKAFATNANTSSFPSKVATITEPTNDGVLNILDTGVTIPQWAHILPYGLGANNDAASMRVIGWRRVRGTTTDITLWVPEVLCEVACTFSAAVGIAGAPVLNTEAFADTITIVSEPTITADVTRQGTVEVYSPANDTQAYINVRLNGVEKIELTWDQTTNNPTTNALVTFF